MKVWLDRVLTALSVIAITFIAFALFRPTGVGREYYRSWALNRRHRNALRTRWNELVESGYPIRAGGQRAVAIEFSDFQCPFCRKAAPRIDSLLASNDSISIVYLNYPLKIHPAADGAAKASICAAEQGRFREMYDQLFTSTQWQEDQDWVREAVMSHVPDTAAFSACLDSPRTLDKLMAQVGLGDAIGVTGTPTFATPRGRWGGDDIPDHFWLQEGR